MGASLRFECDCAICKIYPHRLMKYQHCKFQSQQGEYDSPGFPLVKNSEEGRNFAFMKNRVLKNALNSRPCWWSANLEFRFAPKTGFFSN